VKRKRRPEDFLPLSPLSIGILLAVADEPRHGYGIVKELERETDGRISPGAGTLYAALQRMEDDDFIAESLIKRENVDERRRYYAITPFGRAVARAELNRLSQVIQLGWTKRLVNEATLAHIRSVR
jgi:DNA-binding PadR family transcriptional regulator